MVMSNCTCTNTDNKVHLFVTVFANRILRCILILNPDVAQVLTIKLLYGDSILAPFKLVPRHCTTAHFESFCTMTQNQSLIKLVPRHSYTPESLYHDAKNRAMLRSFRLVPGHYSDSASLLQPSFAQQHKRTLLPGRYRLFGTVDINHRLFTIGLILQ